MILTLQVKQKNVDSMDTISYWLYLGTSIWTASIVLGVIGFVIYIFECIK